MRREKVRVEGGSGDGEVDFEASEWTELAGLIDGGSGV